MLLPYWRRQELRGVSYWGQFKDILQTVLEDLNYKMPTVFSFWTEFGFPNLKILGHVACSLAQSLLQSTGRPSMVLCMLESYNTGYLHKVKGSLSLPLGRLFYSSSDNYMEIFLDALSSFLSSVLNLSQILLWSSSRRASHVVLGMRIKHNPLNLF